MQTSWTVEVYLAIKSELAKRDAGPEIGPSDTALALTQAHLIAEQLEDIDTSLDRIADRTGTTDLSEVASALKDVAAAIRRNPK